LKLSRYWLLVIASKAPRRQVDKNSKHAKFKGISVFNKPPVKSIPQSASPVAMTDAEARQLMDSVTWYHSFELRSGLKTPGTSDFHVQGVCDAFQLPRSLAGKKVVDVGAWDGPLTFELERRGAQAMALDIQDPTRVGFDIARRILGSKAIHYQGSVYQLPYDEMVDLDYVILRGVYYHLKYPLLAFERVAAALKMGGVMCFEGEAMLRYAENLKGERAKLDIAKINASGVPMCLSYPNTYKGASNWFIPNPAALTSWLMSCGLQVEQLHEWTDGKDGQRLYGRAVKVDDRSEMLEHPFY
jgi:tRNA (mo5U34)-methyltransferase